MVYWCLFSSCYGVLVPVLILLWCTGACSHVAVVSWFKVRALGQIVGSPRRACLYGKTSISILLCPLRGDLLSSVLGPMPRTDCKVTKSWQATSYMVKLATQSPVVLVSLVSGCHAVFGSLTRTLCCGVLMFWFNWNKLFRSN